MHRRTAVPTAIRAVPGTARTATEDRALEVPIEMGNEFQDVAGALDWAFKIEEIPDPAVPDTGDNTNVMLYGGMFGVAAMALIVLIVLKKKTKEEQ